ncbi:putative transcriptional regulator [Streptococcus infantarius subsp. infantarius]|nr:putative transcriptional regulator [Streptococcus infantarius subsp. infantarius]
MDNRMNDLFFDKPKNRLELLMQENNYTLKKVSENTGIPVTTLSGYKKNLRTPKKENALKLADYFDVSVPYLLGLEPEVPNSKTLTPFQLLVKDSKLSLKEISEATGIRYSTLGNYNQGTRIPNAKNAQILSDYFGVSVPYLLGLDDNPPALNDSLEKIMVIHEVLDAGDNILVAQELLKNSLETLVKYADNDYRVQFKHHLLIANTLSEVIGKLDIVTENDELSFTPDKLNLSNN